jgi:hypothetical protein
LFQVGPERSGPFYDLQLYPMVDVIVTSDAVRSRYLNDRTRFAAQLAFYDSVERRFTRVADFPAGPAARGPRVTIYRAANAGAVFGQRESVAMPRPLPAPAETFAVGEGAHFFYEMGQNYEEYRFGPGALRAYELAEQLPMEGRAGLFPAVSGAHARCLMAMGLREDALQVLERAERAARKPADLEQIRRYRRAFAAAASSARGGR